MINIQPYKDELKLLEQWLHLKITHWPNTHFSGVTSILSVFLETGCFMRSSAAFIDTDFSTFKKYKDERNRSTNQN